MRSDIKKGCAKVLEDWSMMLVEPLESVDELLSETPTLLVTSVDFKGQFSGKFSVACKEEFALELLENLIGDNEHTDDDIKDCLLELINVLGGNLLTECYGADLVFDLVEPNVSEIPTQDLDYFFDHRTFYFNLDSHPIALRFALKE